MESTLKMTISTVSKVVNITTAKQVAFLLAIALVVIRGLQYLDSDPCKRLIDGGTLVDGKTWQPDGCMLHHYKQSDTKKCLQQQRISFVGDSRIRELFYHVVKTVAGSDIDLPRKMHSDINYQEDDVYLKFHWIPEVNNSAAVLFKSWLKDSQSSPNVIVQAAATHSIKRTNGSVEGMLEYKRNLTNLLPSMNELTQRNSKIFWSLQEPVDELRLHKTRHAITNERISAYNNAAMDAIALNALNTNISIIKSLKYVAEQTMTSISDGLHVGADTEYINVQILLNLFCNNKLKPIDGSCCQPPPHVTMLQLIIFIAGFVCVLLSLLLHYIPGSKPLENCSDVESQQNSGSASVNQLREIATASTRMFLILLYFYICDRTEIFMKSNKHYSRMRFYIPLLYTFLLGMFAVDQVKSIGVLNRDQTDEWKGWMQLVILIYHITGASSDLAIYMHVRLLVAMYLFMTGYGHFAYFWNKGDFSFYRVYNVLFRLNFLTIMLCMVMDRPYQFYYFVPLCTFWFIVLYLAMTCWPRIHIKTKNPISDVPNAHAAFRMRVMKMGIKLTMLALSISVIFLSQNFFELLFSWWPALRLFEWPIGSVREWWFRCQLDRFAMLHGAFFCFVYIILKRLNVMDDSKQGCLFSMRTSLVTVTASIFVIMAYMLWAVQCTSKQACNRVHPFVSAFPITSFILIRNIPGYFRSVYSSFFAWFGKISLELFIGQYHIWLAADTKGTLVLTSPKWPTVNFVVATFLFVCAAHEINLLTGVFVKHCVGSPKDGDKAALLRFSMLALSVILLTILNTLSLS